MSTVRSLASSVAMVMMVVGMLARGAWYADGLRYVALTWMFGDFLFRLGSGIARRWPHWTADSWIRYLKAGTVPVLALLFIVVALLAHDLKLPIVGASRSSLRSLWALGMVFCLIVGAIGMSMMIDWLHKGEATEQFALPRWLSRRRDAQPPAA